MKKIAIITGATGGLGREFVNLIEKEDIEEIWAIARNEKKLESIKKEHGNQIITITKDLTKNEDLNYIQTLLLTEKPQIKYLINNAGVGKMGNYDEFSMEEIETTLDINCKAVTALCSMCIPYMQKGSRILNISSQASFPFLASLRAFRTTGRGSTIPGNLIFLPLHSFSKSSVFTHPGHTAVTVIPNSLNSRFSALE
jgi:short-subunit dehydrogenase